MGGGTSVLLFVYGSLLRGEPQHGLISGATFVGEVETGEGFELRDLGPYPALVAVAGPGRVRGELYRADPAVLEAIDRYEEHPDPFCRMKIPLADGQSAQAYLYVATDVSAAPSIPAGDWRRRPHAQGRPEK